MWWVWGYLSENCNYNFWYISTGLVEQKWEQRKVVLCWNIYLERVSEWFLQEIFHLKNSGLELYLETTYALLTYNASRNYFLLHALYYDADSMKESLELQEKFQGKERGRWRVVFSCEYYIYFSLFTKNLLKLDRVF